MHHNFDINQSFFCQAIFLHNQKVGKIVNITETKKACNMKQKTFFISFKGLSLR